MSADPQPTAPTDVSTSRLDLPPLAVIDLLSSLHRLLKVARMYDKNNKALTTSADAVITATGEYCAIRSSDSADLMFANDTVFANGQMLQMPRDVYERVMELGTLLEKCDVANVNIARTATAADLVSFVHTLGNVLREPSLRAELTAPKYGGVRARPLRWRAGLEGDTQKPVVARTLRTYASAVVILRRFYADVRFDGAGTSKVPLALRRLAQRIVSHAEQEPALLVALAAARNLGTDEAARAVTASLVAVLMGRQLTTDRNALTDLAQAALLHDLGLRRLIARDVRDESDAAFGSATRPLSEDEKARLAASDALAAIGLEGIGSASIPHTVISFEAHWYQRIAAGGATPLYDGKRPASVLGRILAVARSFADMMAPGPHSGTLGPDDAIQYLASRATDDTQRLYIRLLTGGLGIFPAGTSVELSTGEIAVVTCVPEDAVDFARPPVRIMYDASGDAIKEPFDVDLADTRDPGGVRRFIRRALDTDAQQTQAMRAFVLSVSRGSTSKRERPPPPPDAASGKRAAPAAIDLSPPPPIRPEAFEERTLDRPVIPLVPIASTPAESASPHREVPPHREAPAPRESRPRIFDSRSEEGSEPIRAVDIVAPRVRTKPPIDALSPRERTLPPVDVVSQRVRTKPPIEEASPRERTLPPVDVVSQRVRTKPPIDVVYPRERTLPPVDMAALQARTKATIEGVAPRVRTLPPMETASPRIRTKPPIDEAASPEGSPSAPRVRTRPPIDDLPPREPTRPPVEVIGPLGRPITNPMGFRPASGMPPGRPRTDPGASARPRTDPGVRHERSAVRDPRSEPDEIPAPIAPVRPMAEPARAPVAASERTTREIPATKAANTVASAAPTIARSWAEFQAKEETPTAPPPPLQPKPRPTAPSNNAPTVARSWGSFEAEAVIGATEEDEGDEYESNPATRKADWGYDKNVEESSPSNAPRPTRRLDKAAIESELKTPKEPK